MKISTIGYTKKTAQEFFAILAAAEITCVVDIRLHADGQLAGFTKRNDLKYFLKVINDCGYRHVPQLAPSDEILKAYRSGGTWESYENDYGALLDKRGVPEIIDSTLFEDKNCCLLCSEPTADKCHRRLAAEILAEAWGVTKIDHL